ncbi:acyl-CoA N-acyltransferase [Hypoxylon trugodes]|uniref:acyl-CoA N-acyltransferase n=1 Tax=Hypoxylon trugodes TaxID=326681 RepID=UPI00218CEAC0|nr:acyl-CoA N-acyltransferase [Hypoxylon trugodes]KAI1385569.1 acyl-CoA N-acyltransferase [Hypoxylon trugodes]
MDISWEHVETTLPSLPLPPISQRQPITTERLVIRPMREDDLEGYFELRRQPEAMLGTALGKPDSDIDESRQAMKVFLPENEEKSFLFGVFLKSTGELIGEGGVHNMKPSYCSWPEIGYKFKKEFWGQAYGTEFLKAFIIAWWKIPRSTAGSHRVCSPSVQRAGNVAAEQLFALVVEDNIGSRKLLEKLGFVEFLSSTEPDTQVHRLGQPVTLIGYRLSAPESSGK